MNASKCKAVVPKIARGVLWSARTITVLILCFWGGFIASHLLGNAGDPSRALRPADYGILAMMLTSLAGLGVAMRWPRIGGVTTIIAVAIGAMLNWRILMFPSTLIPIAAGLFLLYACLQMTSRPAAATSS